MIEDLIPENAPFDEEQRAWLNGFLAGLLGLSGAPREQRPEGAALEPVEATEYPWADPSLDLERRLKLAEGQPLELRLMAATAQLDCGQCGYSCRGYARALGNGSESDMLLCFPGGRASARALKLLLSEAPAPGRSAAAAAVPAQRSRTLAESEGQRARQESGLPAASPAPAAAGERQPSLLRVKALEKHGQGAGDPELCELVLDQGGAPLLYRVGDCLAVCPQNDPDLVRQLLRSLRARGQELLSTQWGAREAWRCLLEEADITHVRDETLELLGRAAQSPRESRELGRLLEGSTAPSLDLLELLEAFPTARPRLNELVATLGAVQPRLYSIASSPNVHPNEIRLAVRTKGYERGGRERRGVASSFVTGRLFLGDTLPSHVQHTERFVLPNDDQTPLLMLGFGTGIARFRSFLEELDYRGRRGGTWLMLVNRPDAAEPLYDTELKHWLRKGVLERLDVERDGAARRSSASDLLRKRARLLGSWLERGAVLYVCGEGQELLRSLEETLVELISRQLELGPAEAVAYLKAMRRDRRYVCDVY